MRVILRSFLEERRLLSADGPPWCAGQTVGAYTLVSRLGQGGMGSVWLAERTDGEIQQTVAIKLLDAGNGGPEWRRRFVRERQVLASLNHASIVHLLDAGHTPTGGPYLVMEYIEGSAIDDYSARISIRRRLELFLLVCDGVFHAHQRMVIHRDLKPSNILVDASGRPKLLDFGIARLLDQPVDLTQTVESLLTPHYASPEQLRGAPQTTATDIYSLGLVLYKMLTGRLPFEPVPGTPPAGDIPPPTAISRALPSDIDYVVRKALREEPETRYSSVDALAADVRAVIESRPVQARSGDSWYRARRFLRRNWIAAAAIVLLVCGLSTALIMVNRARATEQRRFQLVHELAHRFVFDLHDETAKVAGTTKAREMIVRAGLEYLDSLVPDSAGDLELQKEIAAAYVKVGQAEGFPTAASLGHVDDALASFRKAGELYRAIAARNPVYLPDLARFYVDYSALIRFTHNLPLARELTRSAIRTFDQIRAKRRLDTRGSQSYVAAWCTLGDLDEDLGNFRQSWTDFSQCRDLALDHSTGITEKQALWNLAQADERVGTAASELGLLPESLRAFDEDIAALDRLLAIEPRHPKYRKNRALVDHYRAELFYSDTGASFDDPHRALVSARSYLERAEDMVRSDPNDVSAQLSRNIALFQVAFCLQDSDPETAVAMTRKSVRLFDQLIASGQTGFLITSRRARALIGLAGALHAARHRAEALRAAEFAVAEQRPFAGKDAAELSEHTGLVSALILAGQANAASGNTARAEERLREAREQADSIVKHDELQRLIPLAGAEKALGDFYADRRRTAEARACFQRLAGMWERYPEPNPYADRQRAAALERLASLRD